MILLFNSIVKSDFCPTFSGGSGVLFIIVDDAVLAVIYHLIIAFHISGFTSLLHSLWIIRILIAFQQVASVAFVNAWKLCSHINTFNVRVFFFYFGYQIIAQTVELAFTAKQECINILVHN